MKRALFSGVVLLVMACSDGEWKAPPPGVTRSQRGDTTVVFTAGGGLWGPVHDAVEVLRVAETSKETTFGRPRVVAATPDGGVLVVDEKSTDGLIVRQFSAEGKFVRNIGREGPGPGEYAATEEGYVMLSFDVLPSGIVLLRQVYRGVSRYAATGKFIDGFGLTIGNFGVVGVADGSVYALGTARTGLTAPMLHYDTTGRFLDSIAAPQWVAQSLTGSGGGGRFTPAQRWFMRYDGRLVVGRTDKVGFLVIDPRGAGRPLIAELATAPIVYSADERRELEAIEKWSQENGGLVENGRMVAAGPKANPVPKAKMPARRIDGDIDGRVWIEKSTPSVKGPLHAVYSVGPRSVQGTYSEKECRRAAFQIDGTFLGEVHFPVKACGGIAFVGDFAWSTVPDEDDRRTLVKYRLH